jgi:hypothetical protein
MPRARCRFRETEVTRGYRAIEKAGKKVARVEIDQAGKIVLVIDNDGKNEPESSDIKL